MALIPIVGVPSSYRVPGGFIEVKFAQGPGTASTGVREVLIAMPKLTTGTGTANVLYENIKDASKVEDLAGAGSPAHRCALALLKRNKNARLNYLCVAETTGGSPVAAALTCTVATTPTGTGVATVYVCGEACSYGYTSADTVTTIAAGLKASINAKTHLPVTADNVAGVLTITAKLKGISQGDGTSGTIRVHVAITSGTATTLVTQNGGTTDALGLGAATDGADGTTAEAAQLATALATVENIRKYYVLTSAWDATSLTNIKTHISNKSEGRPGLRSIAIACFPGALAAGSTVAIAKNYERLDIVLFPKAEEDVATIVGSIAGVRSKYEEVDPAYKFSGFSDLGLVPPFDPADWLDSTDQNDAITDGLTPIAVAAGRPYIVMSCSSRSKDAAGTNDDFRATETHRISVGDAFADEWVSIFSKNYAQAKLKDDELLANGTVNTNQRLRPGVVTASTFKPHIKDLLDSFSDRAMIQDVQASKDSLIVVRDPQNTSRLETACQLRVIDHLNQATFQLSEVSPG